MSNNIIISISDGKIKGVVGKNICGATIYRFHGVPYGKPPVGELRFKAPEPVEPWEGVKDATKDGDACFNADPIHYPEIRVSGSENCLVLNVFTKEIERSGKPKPVMVYIHGGGFYCGSNDTAIYGPEFLLTQDIVLVVINYRLGIFGFLSADDVSLDIPGNAGLKDQNLALKWVQKNIGHFNGDPGNVTIFGESAGAASVHLHVLSPASKDLFHKAIAMSGTALCPWVLASSNVKTLGKDLGRNGANEKDILEILKEMSTEEILNVGRNNYFSVLPVIEQPNPTAFLTKPPYELIKTGEYNKVPMIIGYTSAESLLWNVLWKSIPNAPELSPKNIISWIFKGQKETGKIEKIISEKYTSSTEDLNMLSGDAMLLSGIVASIVQHHKTSNQPIYVYRVSVETERNFLKYIKNIMDVPGVCHADELAFLFNIQSVPKLKRDTLENTTVQRFVKLWTNFATYGNPTPENDSDLKQIGITWPPIKGGTKITPLDIGKDLVVLEDLPEADRIDVWRQIFQLSQETYDYLMA